MAYIERPAPRVLDLIGAAVVEALILTVLIPIHRGKVESYPEMVFAAGLNVFTY